MNTWLVLAAAAPGAETGVVDQIKEAFGWNAQLFISQVISFAVVAFLLNKFAYKPILTMLEDRRKRIEESLSNAEKMTESPPLF